jgi:hypothetical protein
VKKDELTENKWLKVIKGKVYFLLITKTLFIGECTIDERGSLGDKPVNNPITSLTNNQKRQLYITN